MIIKITYFDIDFKYLEFSKMNIKNNYECLYLDSNLIHFFKSFHLIFLN